MSLRSDLVACLRSYETCATPESSRLAESSLLRLRGAADTANVIGTNEAANEISPRTLPFLLIDYMLAVVYDEFKGIYSGVERKRIIASAQRYALSFLTRIVDADVALQDETLKKRVRTIVTGDDDTDSLLSAPTDARVLREMKIANFRRERELKQRVADTERERDLTAANTEDGDDDENARAYWLTRIDLAVLHIMSMLRTLKTESDIIREHETTNDPTAHDTTAGSNEAQSKPIETFTIRSSADISALPASFSRHIVRPTDIAQMIDAQTHVRERVFRNPNPSTMTVEQWADQQIALGNLPGPTTNTIPAATQRGGNDDEDDAAVSDEDKDSDAARVKQREWDDWADDHEKGAGNRKTR